jgi:hypothetical protein
LRSRDGERRRGDERLLLGSLLRRRSGEADEEELEEELAECERLEELDELSPPLLLLELEEDFSAKIRIIKDLRIFF